jgi:hypothetical protein
VDHSAKRFAGLAGGGFQVLQEAGGAVSEWKLPGGAAPTAPPSFDRLGSLWVAGGSTVAAFNSDGEIGVLGAPWLEGSQVVALAPSRDGARLALALEAGQAAARLVVTGIVRGEGGVPWRLTGPLEVGAVAGPVASLSWCDDLTLAFLAPASQGGTAAPALFTVGGDVEFLKAPTDAPASLASGRGPDEIFAAGEAGGLFSYSARGRVWSSLAGAARALTVAP